MKASPKYGYLTCAICGERVRPGEKYWGFYCKTEDCPNNEETRSW